MHYMLLGLAVVRGFFNQPSSRPVVRPAAAPVPRPAAISEEDPAPALGESLELADWRAFRAKLEGAGLDAEAREAWSASPAKDGWAHALAAPEAGCLLLGLPFAATLCHESSPWHADVLRFAEKRRTRRCMAAARALHVPASRVALSKSLAASEDRRLLGDARAYVKAKLRLIMRTAPDERTRRDGEFLGARAAAIKRARDVVLVLALDEDGGGTGLRIGRLARGSPYGSRQRSAALCAALEVLETDPGPVPDFHEFNAAFGNDVAVYLGGRNAGDDTDWEGVGWQGSAMLLHSRGGLEGARELAPGCGLYRGGAAAAASLVAWGEADAEEFSFFVGSYDIGPDELHAGVYQPAACASSVVLGHGARAGADALLWRDLMRTLGGASADVEARARGAEPPM